MNPIRVSPKSVENLRTLQPWMFLRYNAITFAYQSCRFCKQAAHEVDGLWKYGVRHYACTPCRDQILAEHPGKAA